MLELAINSSEVRKNFSEFIDNAVHKRPQVIVRNRDHIIAMNTDHLAVALKDLKMTAHVIQDEDNHYITTLDEIDDLIGYGEDPERSLYDLSVQLIEYAQEYMTDSFITYFNAPNRRGHLPYVLKIMLYESPEQIISLLSVEYQRA
jgi:antitoxin YefM